MTITGKKFSELTSEQKIATRLPIAGWVVNNLFINPSGKDIQFRNAVDNDFIAMDDSIRLVANQEDLLCTIPTSSEFMPIGKSVYLVNWGSDVSGITASEGVQLSPFNSCTLIGAFGVFKIEKIGLNEFNVSVIDNGTIEFAPPAG